MKLPSDPRRRRAVLIVLWIVLLVALVLRGVKREPTFDFKMFYFAASAVESGAPLYAGDDAWHDFYFYGPVFVVLFQPLLLFSLEASFIIWTLLSAGAVALAAWATAAALRRLELPTGLGVLLASMAILYEVSASNFKHGNSNAFLMLLVSLAFWGLATRRSMLAGAILALTTTIKVAPIVFLPWLVMRRDGKAVAGFFAGLVVSVALLPALVLGPTRAWEETATWVDHVILPAASADEADRADVLRDAGTSVPAIARHVLDRPTLPPGLGTAIAAFFIGPLLLIAWRRSLLATPLGYGAMLPAMLLAAPVSRAAHFVQLLPLIALLLSLALDRARAPLRSRTAAWSVGAAVLLMVGLIALAKVQDLPSKTTHPEAGLALVLWASSLWLLWRDRDASPTS